jgi:hypothetical protein
VIFISRESLTWWHSELATRIDITGATTRDIGLVLSATKTTTTEDIFSDKNEAAPDKMRGTEF